MLTEADAARPTHDSPQRSCRGSFRDPGGRLYRLPGRILRAVEPSHAHHLEQFLSTRAAKDAIDRGQLVRSHPVPAGELRELGLPEADSATVWEHERIPFASFPYEW